MNSFRMALQQELARCIHNQHGIENYDEDRFGKIDIRRPAIFSSIKRVSKRVLGYQSNSTKDFIQSSIRRFDKYLSDLEYVYANLNPDDKTLIVKLIAFRMMGFKRVKLPRNNTRYWEALDLVRTLKDPNDTYDPHFMHVILEKFDLKPIGYDVQLYFNDLGIAIDFLLEQYSYKSGTDNIVYADHGDIVLDIGGCWGDTALYFASKVGENGKVYSFEFIPDNIKLFNINVSLNSRLSERIKLVQNPASSISGETIYYKDNGPGSRIEQELFEGHTGTTKTIAIDEFVSGNNLTRVDFIKMDIEGAESKALEGAMETIKRFKPKLAIAIYHSMQDFVNIPRWIMDLDLGYELFIGHYTIHAEETICFAKTKDR